MTRFVPLRFLFLIGALLLTLAGWAQQVPAFQWATAVTDPNTPYGVVTWQIAALPNGEICAAHGSSAFINGQLVCVGRYTARGAFIAPLITGKAQINSLKTDRWGNLYAFGEFSDTLDVGTTRLTTIHGSGKNFLFCKWDSTGALQWLKHGAEVSSGSFSYGKIELDGSGNCNLIMQLDTTITFGTVRFQPTNKYDALCVAQFDATGTLRWFQQSVSYNGGVNFHDCAVDPASGDLLIAGSKGNIMTGQGFTWGSQTLSPRRCFWMRLSGQDGHILHEFPIYDLPPNPLGNFRFKVGAGENGYSYLIGCGMPIQDTVLVLNNTRIRTPASQRWQAKNWFARLDPTGTPQWVRFTTEQADFSIYSPASRAGGYPLVYLADSRYNATNIFGAPVGPAASGQCYLAAFDGITGEPQWSTTFGPTCALTDLVPSANGDFLISGSVTTSYLRLGSTLLTFPGIPSSDYKGFVAKMVSRYNQVQGTIYVDADNDLQPTSGERRFENVIVQTQPDDYYFASDSAGLYGAVVELGTHTVSMPIAPLYHLRSPTPPAPASFSTFGNVAPGRDFKLQPVPGQQDVQIFLTPLTEDAIQGNSLRYQVLYRNIGTTTISTGRVVVTLGGLPYVGNTGGGTISSAGDLILFYADLIPGEKRSFEVELSVPATMPAGSPVVCSASIGPNGDVNLADNYVISRLEVIGTLRPFGCRVSWPAITPTQVAAGEWLDYTIYFDNQGTDTVSSVMLRDSLPVAQYRMGSLDLLTASHPCRWRLSPTGVLTATLTGARLTPRTTDARHSAGFARFRVRVAPSLQLGDVVANRAAVHFDARPVAVTPVGLTTVQIVTGLPASPTALAASVWPNPATGTLHVALPHAAPTEALTLTLLDALGRPCLTHTAHTNEATLDVRALPAGLYVLRGQQGGQAFARRVVLR